MVEIKFLRRVTDKTRVDRERNATIREWCEPLVSLVEGVEKFN